MKPLPRQGSSRSEAKTKALEADAKARLLEAEAKTKLLEADAKTKLLEAEAMLMADEIKIMLTDLDSISYPTTPKSLAVTGIFFRTLMIQPHAGDN
jgi:hypothetical protein